VSVEDDNKKLVQDFMKTFGKGDVEAILSFLDESATWWVAGTIEGVSGTMDKAAFATLLAGLSAETRTGAISLTPVAWTVQGERVAVETESYSELKNGRVYNNLYHFLFVVRNGKIHAVREYLDTEHTRAVFVAP
jgi:ketosteroid isomerase-like protein